MSGDNGQSTGAAPGDDQGTSDAQIGRRHPVVAESLVGGLGGMATGGLIGLIEGVRQTGTLVPGGSGMEDGAMRLLGVALVHIGLGFCIGALVGALAGAILGALAGLGLMARGDKGNPWSWRLAAGGLGLVLVVLALLFPQGLEHLLLRAGLVSPPPR